VQVSDVEVAGARIRIQRWGDDAPRPVFYWHGGGGPSDETPVLAPALTGAGYVLHAIDAPGYGDSPPLAPEAYAPSALAGLAAGLLDRLGLAPAVWVGFSWGGNIGLHTAVRFPGSVRALGLLDSGYLQAEDDPEHNPDSSLDEEIENLRQLSEQGESWDAPIEVIAAATVASGREPATRLYPGLRAIGIPVLLAHATEPPELAELRGSALERFRRGLPDARVVPIPGAGHGVLGDNGPETCRVLLDWLAALD
jgi:pimeloyl-ACP methyl ester carboxylesterase